MYRVRIDTNVAVSLSQEDFDRLVAALIAKEMWFSFIDQARTVYINLHESKIIVSYVEDLARGPSINAYPNTY